MTVSVIIPTYQGENRILSTLRALERQTFKNFDVVVLVDGSTDQTVSILKEREFRLKSFKIVEQSNKGKAAARNHGVRKSSGDLVIFCDDDMSPNANSVEKHMSFHLSHPDCLLGGSQFEISSQSNLDIQNYKAHLSQKWLSKYESGLSQMDSTNLFFSSANCSLPRSVFERLGGFDEQLSDAEDYELAFRALKSGTPVYFDKTNESFHRDQITCIRYIKRLRQYATAKYHLDKIHSIEIKKSLRLKRIFYRPFAFLFWARAIDQSFFLVLPKRLRYRLYDVVIHSLAVEFSETDLE